MKRVLQDSYKACDEEYLAKASSVYVPCAVALALCDQAFSEQVSRSHLVRERFSGTFEAA